MGRRDSPRSADHTLGRVQDRELDLRECGDPVEERRPVRRRLREHRSYSNGSCVAVLTEPTHPGLGFAASRVRPAPGVPTGKHVSRKRGIEP